MSGLSAEMICDTTEGNNETVPLLKRHACGDLNVANPLVKHPRVMNRTMKWDVAISKIAEWQRLVPKSPVP